MKTYIDYGNSIKIENTWFSKKPSGFCFQQMQEEIQNNEAVLIPYTQPTPTWENIRAQRDELLKQTDWVVLADADPKPSKEAWLSYRQSLRDIPQNFSTPEAVIWPTKPS